jgi:glycosyltransferase involved in cell wall biosynthesis
MRVVYVIHSANPAGGGPIEGVKQMGVVNRRLGHMIEVVCMDPPPAPWLADFPLPIHPMGPARSGYGYTPRLIPWLRQHASEYDMVVVNGLWQFNGFGVWRALRKTGQPYCLFTHGMLDPWFKRHYPLKHLKKWLYWPWAEYRILRDAAAVLFTSEEERIQARRSFWLYRCREIVVNYGTAGPGGDSAAQGNLFLEKFPALRGKRVLLFLGRIHEKKGCRELIEAFRQVFFQRGKDAGDIRLVMAGPADSDFARELRSDAERYGLADWLLWPGMLTGDLKWGAFHAADAFILPSHQENFGISVAEALACGVPVLISNKVNIWREIEQDQVGLVDSDDTDGAIRLLERWAPLDGSWREEVRPKCRDCFLRRFEITKAAHGVIDVFQSLLDARRSGGAASRRGTAGNGS